MHVAYDVKPKILNLKLAVPTYSSYFISSVVPIIVWVMLECLSKRFSSYFLFTIFVSNFDVHRASPFAGTCARFP